MTKHIHLDARRVWPFINRHELDQATAAVAAAHQTLHDKSGAGNDFLGWVDLPINYDRKEMEKLQSVGKEIMENADALVVIGIGGSYLGARAAIDMFSHYFRNQVSKAKRGGPEIYFAGHNMSPTYMADLLEVLEEKKNVVINVVSKSGTTTEPALAFRILKSFLEKRYGKEEAKKHIIATTDRQRGALKQLADVEGYSEFVVPDNIGGRYSVLTPVGLLPIAACGISIEEMMQGAAAAFQNYHEMDLTNNDCYLYATLRNLLYRKGWAIEMMVNYEPSLHNFSEWWKQLFGESEGKDHKGIFPAACDFTTDLHSMGQYIQEGRRFLFETVLSIEKPRREFTVPALEGNGDGLDFVLGRSLQSINQKATEGTVLAHTDGGVPNLVMKVDELTPFTFGELVYFFEKACGISGYMLGVNPFDQPGVEAYKKNVFALLGKPGYEEQQKVLEKRLGE
ncbi:MAG TPA: glucose-6-phosphate isomerase [Bacillota bacterium]|nr:glucose-6-phosphate isomerase [Bacillota bacterium]